MAKFVILVTGQSNPEVIRAYPSAPNSRAKIWDGGREGTIGTSFVALDPANIQLPTKMASDIADRRPGDEVYVIGVFASGTKIQHWLPGTTAPDVYANLKTNVEAALATIGVSKIDYFSPWQGEANIGESSHAANMSALITRLQGETWFPPSTPILLFGLGPNGGNNPTGAAAITAGIKSVADADPVHRQFLPSAIMPASYWDATGTHMTGDGYFRLGAVAANMICDNEEGWTPYAVTADSGASGTFAASTARFKLLPGKTVVVSGSIGLLTGNHGIYLKISLPFRLGGERCIMSAYNGFTGGIISGAIPPFDPGFIRVFAVTGGYPVDSQGGPYPVSFTGIYERE